MKPRFDEVIILCPETVTGGPEALHQLGHTICDLGGRARIVYTNDYLSLENGRLLGQPSPGSKLIEVYARYRSFSEALPLTPKTLVLYPEIMTRDVAIQGIGSTSIREFNCTLALWWLSLDNATKINNHLLKDDYCKMFFDRPIFHLCQSAYVRNFIVERNSKNVVMISDFTARDIWHQSQIFDDSRKASVRPPQISYSRKGKELSVEFVKTLDSGDVKAIELQGMSRAELRETLFNSRLYIDFGHHPGKDRGPREAALAGAVVLLHDVGSARLFEDHQIPNEYRFSEQEVRNGTLKKRALEILEDPDAHVARQTYYRTKIAMELEQFELEVRAFFFEL